MYGFFSFPLSQETKSGTETAGVVLRVVFPLTEGRKPWCKNGEKLQNSPPRSQPTSDAPWCTEHASSRALWLVMLASSQPRCFKPGCLLFLRFGLLCAFLRSFVCALLRVSVPDRV